MIFLRTLPLYLLQAKKRWLHAEVTDVEYLQLLIQINSNFKLLSDTKMGKSIPMEEVRVCHFHGQYCKVQVKFEFEIGGNRVRIFEKSNRNRRGTKKYRIRISRHEHFQESHRARQQEAIEAFHPKFPLEDSASTFRGGGCQNTAREREGRCSDGRGTHDTGVGGRWLQLKFLLNFKLQFWRL